LEAMVLVSPLRLPGCTGSGGRLTRRTHVPAQGARIDERHIVSLRGGLLFLTTSKSVARYVPVVISTTSSNGHTEWTPPISVMDPA